MAYTDHVSDSENSSDPLDLMRTPRKDERALSKPLPALSHRFRGSTGTLHDEKRRARDSTSQETKIAVMVKGPKRPWEYQPFVADQTVDEVLAEIDQPGGEPLYRIEYEDGRREDVSSAQLISLRNGRNALQFYLHGSEESDSVISMADSSGKRTRTQAKQANGIVNYGMYDNGSDDSEDQQPSRKKKMSSRTSRIDSYSDVETASESNAPRKSSRISTRKNPSKKRKHAFEYEVDEITDSQNGSDGSDVAFHQTKKKSQNRSRLHSWNGIHLRAQSESSSEGPVATRRSGRDRGAQKTVYKEHQEDEEIFADEFPPPQVSKSISIREVFQPISKDSPFYLAHSKECDVCGQFGNKSNKGISPLLHCQGCSTSIHKVCLGYRAGREHAVTKVGTDHFVMQCRRCIGLASMKDNLAPLLNNCRSCEEPGISCKQFSTKKTAKQEEKLRAENGGEDPITEVRSDLIDNANNVLFRCMICRRAWHFEHLPPLDDDSETPEDLTELRGDRINEYTEGQCMDCERVSEKVEALVAWRPAAGLSYTKQQSFKDFREDQREYLVKWANNSYSEASWMDGAWVWGVTSSVMRKAFYAREENGLPKWTFEDAVPKDYLRMEIIFEVKYDGYSIKSLESDKKQINDIEQVRVKFIGLGYDQVVWANPPSPDDVDLWAAFAAAYEEYLAGAYFPSEPALSITRRVERFRALKKWVPPKSQPSALVGGDSLFDYQKEGLDYLLYKFQKAKNVILADEMGLGKTIQVIAFVTALITKDPKCWPFLVVTPNSTCPNWRREIKKWAPTLRVVAYYGGKEARDTAYKYELFPGESKDMKAHVVITSYDAVVGDAFFKKVKWAGLIVDEGQRLKNTESQLSVALKNMNFPFRLLMTGTPLQNNKKELFNLLEFLDPTLDAEALDKQYEFITKENISHLHKQIRPFMLRRTKIEVLDLPPMSQNILPVTMSQVQKELYKSILNKNIALINAILDKTATNGSMQKKERGNLNNILMQLRKCLCHPYVYNDQMEDRNLPNEDKMRKLISASCKFQVLETMLPKLKERGHRILIFSQFLDQLDILEDFLDYLGLPYQRLDGKINALEKQRRIDQFNAPDSKLFAFLLSTRAGGVGINLATADTVIVMDPDFNPHQDLQAISRAHRLGQKKPVLVLSFMTRYTAEEKIVQIGNKKMALDHALIESIDIEDAADVDVESILKHGAAALFENGDDKNITYDATKIDKLLDRTFAETEKVEKGGKSQFSTARVWVGEKDDLAEVDGDSDAEPADDKYWRETLAKAAKLAAAEELRNAAEMGRGRRQRNMAQSTAYHNSAILDSDESGGEPSPPKKSRKRKIQNDSGSEVEYTAAAEASEDDDYDGGQAPRIDHDEENLGQQRAGRRKGGIIQGTMSNTIFKPILEPPWPTKSGKTQRGHCFNLSRARNSAKVQRSRSSPHRATKHVVGHKSQPTMDTAVKQINTPVFRNLASAKQQVEKNIFTTRRRVPTAEHSKITASLGQEAHLNGRFAQARRLNKNSNGDMQLGHVGADSVKATSNAKSANLSRKQAEQSKNCLVKSTGGKTQRSESFDQGAEAQSKIRPSANKTTPPQTNKRQEADTSTIQTRDMRSMVDDEAPLPSNAVFNPILPPSQPLANHPAVSSNLNRNRVPQSRADLALLPHTNPSYPFSSRDESSQYDGRLDKYNQSSGSDCFQNTSSVYSTALESQRPPTGSTTTPLDLRTSKVSSRQAVGIDGSGIEPLPGGPWNANGNGTPQDGPPQELGARPQVPPLVVRVPRASVRQPDGVEHGSLVQVRLCPRCGFPHQGATCPKDATHAQLRIMIDDLASLESTFKNSSLFKKYLALLWKLLGERSEQKRGQPLRLDAV